MSTHPKKKTVRKSHKMTGSGPPNRGPYNFLMRNLNINNQNEICLKKICAKRLYIKNFTGERDDLRGGKMKSYKPYRNNKIFKTLINVEIPSITHSYAYETFKNSKNIKRFNLNLMTEDLKLSKITPFIKRLPTQTKILSLDLLKYGSVKNKHLFRIAKSIRHLPQLQSFKRSYFFDQLYRSHIQRDLRILNRSASILKRLNQVTYVLSRGEQQSFQRTMRNARESYPGITGLEVKISPEEFDYDGWFDQENSRDEDFPSKFDNMAGVQQNAYDIIQDEVGKIHLGFEDDPIDKIFAEKELERQRQQLIAERNNRDNSSNDNDTDTDDSEESFYSLTKDPRLKNVDEDFIDMARMREEIRPFYRFDLFPNLKKLRITHSGDFFPLDSFVIDGFKSLKHLEDIIIDIDQRSQGTNYIFKGLLELPLLKKFSLYINFIKNPELEIMQKFLKGQVNLESIHLSVRGETTSRQRYLQQNVYLVNIIRDFQDKKSLKSIHLRAHSWSLEAVSKGFGHLTRMKNQIRSLTFEGLDDTVFSSEKVWKRVEGICNFIKNQSKSLHKIQVFLPCAFEENIMKHISEAISHLSELRDLHLSVNPDFVYGVEAGRKYLEETLQRDVPDESKFKLKRSKTWNPNLAKCVKKLENLEEFSMTFDIAHDGSVNWYSDLWKAFLSLRWVKEIKFNSFKSSEKLRSEEQKVIAAVQELKSIRHILLLLFGENRFNSFNPYSRRASLEEAVSKVHKKQAQRCDLMF